MNTSQLETKVRSMEERVEEKFHDASRRLRFTKDRVAEFVKDHPVSSLAGAFVIGFVIARAARR